MNLNIEQRINTSSRFYKQKYGKKMYKIGLSTGLECPQRLSNNPCLFCDPLSFIDQHSKIQDSISKQIDYLSQKLISQYGNIGFIGYFQDNTSTYGDLDYLEKLYKEADQHPSIQEIIVSTRPDYVYQNLLNIFQSFNHEVTIELGIQSIHDKSLKYLNRNHTQKDNRNALVLLKSNKIRTSAHIILGIPGEKRNDILETINFLIDYGIREIKFHHLVVYKGTRLANIYKPDEWECAYRTLEEYVNLISDIVQYIHPDVVISRFFTSNISCQKNALNQFPGTKKIWINLLTKILNEKNSIQGIHYNNRSSLK